MSEITVAVMPQRLAATDLDAVRNDPLCSIDDQDEMHKRIGWLVCAYDAIVEARLKTPNDKVQAAPCLQGVAPATPG